MTCEREEIAQLNQRANSCLRLDKVRWADGKSAFDLRIWVKAEPPEECAPGRGIVLRYRDLVALYEALHKYFTRERPFAGDPEKAEQPEEVFLVNDTPL